MKVSDNYYSTDDTSAHEKYIAAILPGKYTYKFTEVQITAIFTPIILNVALR